MKNMKNNKKIILIVEDELALQKALSDKLAEEGFSVLIARDGQEGLEIAKKNHPNLILLDIIMPVMDGITMFKKLREDDWGKTAKIIILTNLSEGEKVTEAEILNSSDYLIKSDWSLADVVKKIKSKIGEK